MSLRVLETSAARQAEIHDDPYIPFKVRWASVGMAGPLAFFFTEDVDGSKYGYVEIGIEPLTGEILSAIVVLAPTRRQEMPPMAVELPIVEGALRVDMTDWLLNPDNVPTLFRVDVRTSLGVAESERHVYFSFCEVAPVQWTMAGNAGFGVGPQGEVTGLLAVKVGGWAERLDRFVDRHREDTNFE